MPPLVDDIDDEEYASDEDPDFAPDAVPAAAVSDEEASASESEAEVEDESVKKGKAKSTKRKRGTEEEAEDVGFENSGDEEIVERGLKKQRRKKRKGELDSDEEGGEGGFVKTRRMAALAPEEKKPLVNTATATVDVDALWAQMITGTPTHDATVNTTPMDVSPAPPSNGIIKDSGLATQAPKPETSTDEDAMIKIQRTYNFAGKVHTEEKLVPRDSAEAKLYLASVGTTQPPETIAEKPKRPAKKARRSIFEPITESLPQRTDLNLGVRLPGDVLDGVGGANAKKLNTVEKSKMDWAGFVDKEGIKEELEIAGKAKSAYLGQKEFLNRVEDKREEEARRARFKARDAVS